MESTPELSTDLDAPLVIEYAPLVTAIQLSVARELNVPGALDAQYSLSQILDSNTAEEKHKIECEIGLRFDEALINFVVSAIIRRRNRSVIIIAGQDEGIDGFLPWQKPLAQRVMALTKAHALSGITLRVERVPKMSHLETEVETHADEHVLELINS